MIKFLGEHGWHINDFCQIFAKKYYYWFYGFKMEGTHPVARPLHLVGSIVNCAEVITGLSGLVPGKLPPTDRATCANVKRLLEVRIGVVGAHLKKCCPKCV